MNLTDEDVREILKLLDESPYDELTLETDRFKLSLSNTRKGAWMRQGTAAPALAPKSPEAPLPAAVKRPAAAVNGEIRDIRPPMPGTFYRAPSPGAEPFTEVGKSVTENSILGLVETMKLMNSV
ncbi:MAG TPA: biotin/lipoyl-containing protein, partial [Woeseiaceae bacterium]|nr:biotin/lipoyl-containing protein [Woeseiaceae bacterium]